ncbi:ribosome-associated translation inhibitor RaiA [Kineococcus sp. R8]|uniref:ribosome hibernation-promoting factor, HPF/YfiA family n=1 Tax=Kineococcus siccus TaxID=2696567 RepID=UPI003B8352F1|nr:ribosome-associated translation inhibitor RaiA [Kineococcus siccus]
MEVVVTGRHTEVQDRFRRHVEDKLEKVTQLAPRVQRIDVELSHEKNRRQASACERVEITVRDKGPVVRAEACADDPYAALDLATTKLMERLRRSRDRRKVHHGRHRPVSVHQATAGLSDEALVTTVDASLPPEDSLETTVTGGGAAAGADAEVADESPVVIREKAHAASPMTLDQALYEMELVGHDFYLFVEAGSHRPSVVYRRHGWDYGVIHLDVVPGVETPADAGDRASRTSSDAALAAVVAATVR